MLASFQDRRRNGPQPSNTDPPAGCKVITAPHVATWDLQSPWPWALGGATAPSHLHPEGKRGSQGVVCGFGLLEGAHHWEMESTNKPGGGSTMGPSQAIN